MQTVNEEDMCWACDNWVYTLYFWNEKVGQYNDRNYIGVDMQTKKQMVNTIRQHNKQTYMNDPDVPVLFSATS